MIVVCPTCKYEHAVKTEKEAERLHGKFTAAPHPPIDGIPWVPVTEHSLPAPLSHVLIWFGALEDGRNGFWSTLIVPREVELADFERRGVTHWATIVGPEGVSG
jgi:hypothetical protein